MPSRIDVIAPATITVLAGNPAISSLLPGAISITDPNPGIVTVTLVSADAATGLAAGSAGGASIASHANTLTITGNAAQVNAALATLQIDEAAGATTDTIFITATDPAVLAGQSAIAVNVAPAGGPAFAAPPASFSLRPDSLTALTGLVIGDPSVSALDAAGEGAQETLAVTLSATSGVLFLPGFSALDGISETGLGTGTIQLSFTADRLGAVNALLASLEFAAPGGTTGLAYALHDVSGPLGPEYTNGNIVLNVAGTAGANGTFGAGGQTLIVGPETLSPGASFGLPGITGDLGGIAGGGFLVLPADSEFNLPYNALSPGGSSLDFGELTATTYTEAGSIVMSDGADFAGPVLLGSGGLINFAGALTADGAAQVANQLAVSLNAGAVILGDGVLIAGNFSEAGRITGPGTLAVDAGGTLLLAAGSIGGGAHIDVAAGGVALIGPVDPLYGVFNATPLTIDSSVTLSFSGVPGAAAISGGFADPLDQNGGVFVIAGPQAFSGTITGFTPGDRLIFPGLANLNLFNITTSGFSIAGEDSQGVNQTYTIHATTPGGTQLYLGTDNAGDSEVSLRDTHADVFANDGVAVISATPGVAQPILGLEVLPTSVPTGSLTVTLSVVHGLLSDAALGPAASLTITAANPAALNNALAGVIYTGTGVDGLTITGAGGALSGLSGVVPIQAVAAGTVSGFAGGVSAAELAAFSTASLAPVTGAVAPGAIAVSALTDFDGVLQIDAGQLFATAITIGNGAAAVFGAAAAVSALGDVVLGDALGAGSIAILGDSFLIGNDSVAANLVLADRPAGAGDAAVITGTLGIGGSLYAGISAAVYLSGQLGETATTIAANARFTGDGAASAAFGRLVDTGTVALLGQTQAAASTADISGTLALGGTALFTVQSQLLAETLSQVTIGADATLQAATILQTGGGILDAGTVNVVSLIAVGTITLNDGALDATALTLNAGAVLAGAGAVNAVSLKNTGTIQAAGAMTLAGAISNLGLIELGTLSSLDITRNVTGNAISFTGANAELTINDVSQFTAGVTDLVGHDVIDLIGVAPSLVSFAAGSISGSITVTDTGGNRLGGFTLGVASGQPAVQIKSDGHGGALITLGGEMPCFARGTSLLTPNGYRPVESFAPGDPVITAAGERRAIRWIGSRTLDLHQRDLHGLEAAGPVLIAAHAFGPGRPRRPLRLSPLHAVFCDGVLVPALHLVNGATITAGSGHAAVTYYHIELDSHDIVVADGLACETYLDNGNRAALYRERGVRAGAGEPCAKLVTSGPRLAAIRRLLHERALAAGFSLTYQARLRGLAGQNTMMPEIRMVRGRRVACFPLPPGQLRLTLLSGSASPADTEPGSEDRRQLGVCLAFARAGGRFRPRLGAGWLARAATDQGIWMGRRSELMLMRPAASVTLTLAAIVQSWVPPPARTAIDSLRHRA